MRVVVDGLGRDDQQALVRAEDTDEMASLTGVRGESSGGHALCGRARTAVLGNERDRASYGSPQALRTR